MSIKIPAWLNSELLKKVLREHERDQSIEVKDLSMKRAVAKGNNYGGDIIRVGVEYTSKKSGQRVDKKLSLIVKVMIEMDATNMEMIAKSYNVEIKMLSTILEKMNDILKGKVSRLSPRTLYCETSIPSFIVMEDLAPLNYRLANRHIGLDLEHSLLTLKRMAEFHASSVALWEKDPSAVATGCKGIYSDEFTEEWKQFIKNNIDAAANEVVNWTELGSNAKPMSDKLHALANVAFETASKCTAPRENDFNVINHGDCWLNNMLFRYNEEGKLIDHIFIDFQVSVWSSPAIDISYLFNSSLSEDVELHHRDALLDAYLDNLTKTMTDLGCKTKPPSMAQLKKSLRERAFYGVATSFIVLPTIIVDAKDAPKLEDFLGNDNYVSPTLKTAAYRKILLRRLSEWKEQGILDI